MAGRSNIAPDDGRGLAQRVDREPGPRDRQIRRDVLRSGLFEEVDESWQLPLFLLELEPELAADPQVVGTTDFTPCPSGPAGAKTRMNTTLLSVLGRSRR
jgi:hypothetical protein